MFRKYVYDPFHLIIKTCRLVNLTIARMIKENYSKSFYQQHSLEVAIRFSYPIHYLLATNPVVLQGCLTFAYMLSLNLAFVLLWVEIIGEKSKICDFFGHRDQLPIYFYFTNRLRDFTAQPIIVVPMGAGNSNSLIINRSLLVKKRKLFCFNLIFMNS